MHAEYQEHHEIVGPSDRSFGLTVGSILALLEAYRYWFSSLMDIWGYAILSVAGALIFFGICYPTALAIFNQGWMKLGLAMYKIVNPVILFLLYVTAIIPTGLVLKILGKDILHLEFDAAAKSYWIERNPKGPSPESMKNQF